MTLNEIIKQSHDNAVKRDKYDCKECHGKGGFYIEGVQWLCDCTNCNNTGKTAKLNVYFDIKKEAEEFINAKPTKKFHKDSEQSEIADMIMILLAYSKEMNYDIEKAIVEKLEYNKTRVD